MDEPLPPHAYVPGGPFARPEESHDGEVGPIVGDDWRGSPAYLRGIRLWNAGYYWEAHEVWEGLWHVEGRRGPVADLLKALIKLAAAGVKVRQGQPHGVRVHARRAADLIRGLRDGGRDRLLGLDLARLEAFARSVAEGAPDRPAMEAPVMRVFDGVLAPDDAP